MRTKSAGMFVVAILAMSATGCAAGSSGAGPDAPVDVPSELADDRTVISEEDSASRPRNEAAPTTPREFNGTEPNLANRSNGGQRNDPYLPPQAVVPDEPTPQPPTDADVAPSTPPETDERPRPSFPRVTDPVPVLPLPPFGADIEPSEPTPTDGDDAATAAGATESDDAEQDPDRDGESTSDADDATDADSGARQTGARETGTRDGRDAGGR